MRIDDFLHMNNWKIGKFLKFVLSIQLAMLGLVGLSALGFGISVSKTGRSGILCFINITLQNKMRVF
ncbi:hypothetical protein ES703_20009 [subsurface metagenome]